jgi:hypothetical protein
MFGDPPEREKEIHLWFHWRDFEGFPREVVSVLEEHRACIKLSGSFNSLAGVVLDRERLFVLEEWQP